MKINHLLPIALYFLVFSAFSQNNPDLFVVNTAAKGGKLQLLTETVKQLTDRKEYDSQPSFINEYQLVFSAADEKGNHDIIVYNFENQKFTNLSKTDDRSEFSPSITDCGQYIAAVVMEADKRQRLWLYPTNFEPAELLYDDIEPVGYYDWYDNKAAMFVLGEPNSLVYANGREDIWELDENIGRSVKLRPKTSQMGYLRNSSNEGDPSTVNVYDLKSKQKTPFGSALMGSSDFIWVDKNHILMGRGDQVFIRDVRKNEWTLLATLPSETHENITRMAYSADLNVLVYAMNRK
ncbi:TolB family protein [Algoriphagus namhaensis]|uniref:TolB family protein n=1 Tax=Algoriphagus namhaensis TaxID=915353 RepID=A0ABV8AU29_9BACT